MNLHENFAPESAASSAGSAADALRADFFDSTLARATGGGGAAAAAAPMDAPAPAGISAASWSQISNWVADEVPVHFTTAGSGAVPDYILGADGKLTANPAATPSADGSITVQVAGGDQAAKKAAQDLEVATVQCKIAYWQKGHPGSEVPDFLKGELATAQSLSVAPEPQAPAPERPAPQAQPQDQPMPQSDPPPTRSAPSFGGPGSESLGGRNIGNGGYRPGSFEPNPPTQGGVVPPPVAGDLNIKGPPSCTADQIQTFLTKMGSPAAQEQGFSQALFDACTSKGIDPAVAVGFFLQESTCGRFGRGHENHSIGNIKGTAPESGGSDGTFRHYNTWAEGARDWARLIGDVYGQQKGLNTLSQVIHTYAPGSDGNNERGYVSLVKGVVESFKQQNNNTPVVA